MAEHKIDAEGYGVWYCAYCGLTAPRGHWRPRTYIEKHEEHCPKTVSYTHLTLPTNREV